MLLEQTVSRTNLLNYYTQSGPMTDPQDQARLFADLPTDIPSLVKVVQGVIIHPFWMQRYGLPRNPEREERETNLRLVDKTLARMMELDNRQEVCRQLPRSHDAAVQHPALPGRARSRALRLRRVLQSRHV